jgi:spore germination protein YaaH
VLTIILLIIASVSISIYNFYFAPNNKIVQAFDEGKLNLVIGDKLIDDGRPVLHNQEVLLPFDVVKKYIDSYIFQDKKLKKVIATTNDKVVRMNAGSLEAFVNNKPFNLKSPIIEENNELYLPASFLNDFYKIEINYLKDKNVIIIDKQETNLNVAVPISIKAAIRKGKSVKFPIYKKFNIQKESENKMVVFDDSGSWYKVRSQEGIVGFIEKKYIKVTNEETRKAPEVDTAKEAWKPKSGKINLVWDAIYKNNYTGWKDEDRIEGLDVISPTWFELRDGKGTVLSRASLEYVEWAHQNNYKIWAHLSNNLGGADNTGVFLNSTDARENTINKVLGFADKYKLDGINIDFEDMNMSDKDVFTQFVRELSPLLKEKGLAVSIDVTPLSASENWSLCYDRKALAESVDYMMLMAYDQHWATSPLAGSVAQQAWVEDSVKKILQYVPKEKLLLGLPYYTRVWIEESGKNLKSAALSMEKAKDLIKENNAQVKWDEESGQFYAEYNKKGINNKIWLENEESINLKSSLVHKYELAGAAGWRKDFEISPVWKVLNKNLKVLNSYEAWLSQNKEKKYVYKD